MTKEEQYHVKEINIAPMLNAALGTVYRSTLITEVPGITYPTKPAIWDNWFPFAYVAFSRINKKIKSFATIGTGPGADAIGADFIFQNLERIVVTDIDPRVTQIAKDNVKKYLKPKTKLIAQTGNLCEPLRRSGIKVDALYENLPNIPTANLIIENNRISSQFDPAEITIRGNDQITKYLLSSHYACLIEASNSLNAKGIVISAIGGRVPYNLIRAMIESAGYEFHDLVSGFKLQTEPEDVLQGYARAETDNEVEFDFYDYEKAVTLLKEYDTLPFIKNNGPQLKKNIEPARITAKQALGKFQQNPKTKIGHVVHMIGSTKQ